ncbi:MAG TPA: hypothetical protein VN249_09075 [Prolixibacteraceae bacterium]|nr:hypothetical protein [Prolixibacteraceae bacterium]
MKFLIFSLLLASVLFSACNPSLNVTKSYVNRDIKPNLPYKLIFVFAMVQDQTVKKNTEDRLEKLFKSRGVKVLKSSVLFPQTGSEPARLSVEQNTDAIKKAGCDAIMTIAVVDVEKNESYNPGTAYAPSGTNMAYGSYFGYYNYMNPYTTTPGFYSVDKTYYMETKFYDVASDKLLWAINSTTYSPNSFESWFQDYSGTILSQLKKDGLIKK